MSRVFTSAAGRNTGPKTRWILIKVWMAAPALCSPANSDCLCRYPVRENRRPRSEPDNTPVPSYWGALAKQTDKKAGSGVTNLCRTSDGGWDDPAAGGEGPCVLPHHHLSEKRNSIIRRSCWCTASRGCSIPRWRSCIACGRTGNWRIRTTKIYYKKNFCSGIVCLLLGVS